MYNKIFITTSAVAILSLICGCKKFVDPGPSGTGVNTDNVYNTDATAAAVLTGIYTNLSTGAFCSGINGISLVAGLSADEFKLFDGLPNDSEYIPYYRNALTSKQTGPADYWSQIYSFIYPINSAIEGLNNSNGLTPTVKQHLIGEAKFMRAFCYFYLVNLYADVPLVTTSDYKTNSSIVRSSKADVYGQILTDLKDAQSLLSTSYLNSDALTSYASGSEERVRPTSWAATALLARVYLYQNDWNNAEEQATKIINNTSLFSLELLENVFKKNSKEAIWQLQPVNVGKNTEDGFTFIIPSTGLSSDYPVSLNKSLVASFDDTDQRKKKWIGSVVFGSDLFFYAYKYQSGIFGADVKEYLMVMRLAEQYLIRAEARAHLNKISEAKADLDAIRNRGYETQHPSTGTDQSSLLNEIMLERQHELFTEWGNRWFDLKRTGLADVVMSNATSLKGGVWKTTDQLYPIPLGEMQKNPKLIQNPGY